SAYITWHGVRPMNRRQFLATAAALAAARALPAFAADDNPDYLSWARPGSYRAPAGWTDFTISSWRSDRPGRSPPLFLPLPRPPPPPENAARHLPPPTRPHPAAPTRSRPRPRGCSINLSNQGAAPGPGGPPPASGGAPAQPPRRVAPAPELNYFATEGIPPMLE